jgi:hypothetical protein
MGLGGKRGPCRDRPEEELARLRGVRVYEKRYLAQWAREADPARLAGEPDFEEYLASLRWLIADP